MGMQTDEPSRMPWQTEPGRGRRWRQAQTAMMALLRQPLCSFLLVGATLYLAHGLMPGQGRPTLVLSTEELAYLARLGQDEPDEAPTPEALRLLAAERLRQLALIDAARQMGLDRGDLIIERRLMEKMRFVLAQQEPAPQPTEQELQAFLQTHPERYEKNGTVGFEQLFFAEQAPCSRARKTLPSLLAGQDVSSDPMALGRSFAASTASTVQSRFGKRFWETLQHAPLHRWQGPVTSRYGCHLIRVSQRTVHQMPALADVRERVLLDWQTQAQQHAEQRALCRLLGHYRIITPASLTLRHHDLCPPQSS